MDVAFGSALFFGRIRFAFALPEKRQSIVLSRPFHLALQRAFFSEDGENLRVSVLN